GWVPSSSLPQYQINHPAAPDMFPRLPAVVQDVPVGIAGLFQGIGQDGQMVKGPVFIDGLGHPGQGPILPGQPAGIKGHRPEGVTDNVPEKVGLGSTLDLAVILPYHFTDHMSGGSAAHGTGGTEGGTVGLGNLFNHKAGGVGSLPAGINIGIVGGG